LDRLARSTLDLLTTVKQIADNDCLFKSLAEPWADTTTPAGRLMLTVLGGLAEFERELIKIRTSEGRERAKRAGVRDGTQAGPQRASGRRNSREKGKRSIRPISRKIIPSFAKHDFTGQMTKSAEERRLYASVDTGFIGQNVYLFCASEGLASVFRGAVDYIKLLD
jgi:DNA invertase Pin-like site-specific DNA recombinase